MKYNDLYESMVLQFVGRCINKDIIFRSYYDLRHTLHNINPIYVNFFRGNKNLYLHLMSFLHIDMTQIVENPPQVRQELIYSI